MITKILEEINAWVSAFIRIIPGRIGRLVRRIYYRMRLKNAGKVLSIGMNVEIACENNIEVGNNIFLVDGAIIRACDRASIKIGNYFAMNGNARLVADCCGEIIVGNNVLIGPNVVIRASNHRHERIDVSIWSQGQTGGKIEIGDDVWIASNVVILPDVKIGSHTIIAAGAVVTRDIPEYSVVAGVPAKVVKNRKE